MTTPLKDMKAKGLRLIQYGNSGVGKSVRASEAARWGLVEYHDFDDQTGNLLRYLEQIDPKRIDKIQVVSYTGLSDNDKALKFLARLKELKVDTKGVTTLVLDSYTKFEDVYTAFVLGGYTPSNTGFGAARTLLKIGDSTIINPGASDYAALASSVKKLTGWLRDLNVNIILNAHVRDYIENKGEVIEQGTVAAKGQIRGFLPTEFAEWHYLFVDDYGKHRVQVKPSRYWLAKSALPNVPSNGVIPTTSLDVFDSLALKKV